MNFFFCHFGEKKCIHKQKTMNKCKQKKKAQVVLRLWKLCKDSGAN